MTIPASNLTATDVPAPRMGKLGRLVMILKIGILIVCGALLWRAWPAEPDLFIHIWQHPWYLGLAIVFRPVFTLLLGLRLSILCRRVLPPIQWRQIGRIAFVGQMFNQFLPGGVGGDAVRGLMLRRSTGQAWARIGGVLIIDRLLGLVSITLCMLLFAWPMARERWGQASLAVTAVLVMGLMLLGLTGWWHRPVGMLKASSWGRELWAGVAVMGPARLLMAGVVALLAHGCLLASCGFVFDAVDCPVAWLDRFGVLAITLFIGALPLAVGGHGVREGTLVMLLSAASLTHAREGLLPFRDAMVVAVVTLTIHLATNLGGGVIALLVPASNPSST